LLFKICKGHLPQSRSFFQIVKLMAPGMDGEGLVAAGLQLLEGCIISHKAGSLTIQSIGFNFVMVL
jgi:hypothetical protein